MIRTDDPLTIRNKQTFHDTLDNPTIHFHAMYCISTVISFLNMFHTIEIKHHLIVHPHEPAYSLQRTCI